MSQLRLRCSPYTDLFEAVQSDNYTVTCSLMLWERIILGTPGLVVNTWQKVFQCLLANSGLGIVLYPRLGVDQRESVDNKSPTALGAVAEIQRGIQGNCTDGRFR